jgi:outer membrane cobalamin receptor
VSTVRLTSRVACVALALAWGACTHSTDSGPPDVYVAPDGRRIITERAVEKSGAQTAWDALQRTVPFFTFNVNNRGGPARIEHRGRSSIILRDQPKILVDDVELTDFGVLGTMPASDILEIEVWSGVDATTYYGTNASKGVIRIRTKLAPT